MLQKPKRHKNNKESHLQNRYPTDLRQSSNAIRVKFSRYKQNQIFTNVSFDTLILKENKYERQSLLHAYRCRCTEYYRRDHFPGDGTGDGDPFDCQRRKASEPQRQNLSAKEAGS